MFLLSLGNLHSGVGNGGLSNVNANNGLSNTRWNILARKSDYDASRDNAVRPEPIIGFRTVLNCVVCIILAAAKICQITALTSLRNACRTVKRIGFAVGLVVKPKIPVTLRKNIGQYCEDIL